jgi:hypothetical protein
MAPERPSMLVVLDIVDREGTGWVHHWDPDPTTAEHELVVLWEAAGCPDGFVDAPARVACVLQPPGYRRFRYPLEPSHAGFLSWRGQPRGSSYTMLVAILPKLHKFVGPANGTAWPSKAKIVAERMAVYWLFRTSGTVEPCWLTEEVDDVVETLASCSDINSRSAAGNDPEPRIPRREEREEWAKQRAKPEEGKPD